MGMRIRKASSASSRVRPSSIKQGTKNLIQDLRNHRALHKVLNKSTRTSIAKSHKTLRKLKYPSGTKYKDIIKQGNQEKHTLIKPAREVMNDMREVSKKTKGPLGAFLAKQYS